MKLRSNKTQLRKFQKNAKLKKGSKQSLRGKLTKRHRGRPTKIEESAEDLKTLDEFNKKSEDSLHEENLEDQTEVVQPLEVNEIEDAFEVVDDDDEDDDENLEEILQARVDRENNQKSKTSSVSAAESEIVTAPSGDQFEFTFYPTNEKEVNDRKSTGNEFEIECVESIEEMDVTDIAVKQEKNDATVKLSDDDVMTNLDGRCFCQVIIHKPTEYPGCVHFNAGQRTYRCPRCSERLGSLGDYISHMSNHEDYSEESKSLADMKSIKNAKFKAQVAEQQRIAEKRKLAEQNRILKQDIKSLKQKLNSEPEKTKKAKNEDSVDKPWTPVENRRSFKKRGRPSKEDKKRAKEGNPINFEKESKLPKITPSKKKALPKSFQTVSMNIPTQLNQLQAVPMMATSTPTQIVINSQPMMAMNPTLPLVNMPANQLTFLQNSMSNSGQVIVKMLDNANFIGQNFISPPTQMMAIPKMTPPTQTGNVTEKKAEVRAEIKTELEEIIDDSCDKPTLSTPTQSNGTEAMVMKDEVEDEFYIGGAEKPISSEESAKKSVIGEMDIYRCEFCKRKFDCPRGLKVHIGYCKNFDKFKKSSASGEPLTINLTDRFVPFYPNSNIVSSNAKQSSIQRGAYSQKASLDAKIAKLKESAYDSEVRQALSGIKVQINKHDNPVVPLFSEEHETESKQFMCTICSKRCYTAARLELHSNWH